MTRAYIQIVLLFVSLCSDGQSNSWIEVLMSFKRKVSFWICLCACLLGVQNILRLGDVIVAAHYCCCFDDFMLDTSIPILFATLFTFIHFLHSFTRIDDLLCLMFVVAVRQGTVCFSVQWFPVVHYSNDTPFHREGVPTRCQRLLVQNVQRGMVIKT